MDLVDGVRTAPQGRRRRPRPPAPKGRHRPCATLPSSVRRSLLALLCACAGLVWPGGARPAAAAPQGRIRLVRQTSWVTPGDTLTMAMRTAEILDAAALELAVTVHPAVKTRVDLARSMIGEGLRSPLGPRSSGAVPLTQVPTDLDGTLTVQVPTQMPGTASDPTRIRLPSAGIYPVQIELRELDGGDTVDRFTTHLLAVKPPDDGSRLGAAIVLPLSAPPSTGPDGTRTGPPAGASALADAAAGLRAAPDIPVAVAPTPEVLEALASTDAATAQLMKEALGDRDVIGRPFVPLDVPGLGSAAGPLLPEQLATGQAVARSVLGGDPISGIWLADEPLDGPALTQVVTAGSSRLVLPQSALGPVGASTPAALRPVTLLPAGAPQATALVADATLAGHLDGRAAGLDQPLQAHHLLADLAAVATLPGDQGLPAPGAGLDRRVATVFPDRGFTPTSGFLTELLGGLAASPVLRAVDLASAFGLPPEPLTPLPAPRATTTTRSRRGTTTTVAAPTGRTLAPLPPGAPDRAIGDVAADALWQLSTHEQVLPDATPLAEAGRPPPGAPDRRPAGTNGSPGPAETEVAPAVALRRRLLVATSADLPVDQRRERLKALADGAKADLAAVKMPESRTLRLTARAGQLPVGIFNDTGRTAHVLLQLESEKLEFPVGSSSAVRLDRRTNIQPIAVRVRASGSFPVKVRLLTPDGSRVLQETEYVVRANTVPGVAIAVGGAAALFLAVWWAKTLLPERKHARRRHGRRRRQTTGTAG